ncbi:MAG: NADH-quinone oxidoreductase subunit J family protein [Candidatus Dormibacteria bacterium]
MSNPTVYAISFYVLAVLVLGSALAVVSVKNIVHAALALIATFFFVAWLYLLMNADLLWVAQLLIYAGAIPVLVVFAIMLTRRSMSDTSNSESGNRLWGALISAGIFLLLALVLLPANWYRGTYPQGEAGTVRIIGTELVNRYAVPFEVVSVLLLVGLIGAVVLARREGR